MDSIWQRFVHDLMDRLTGPMNFRFLLQPTMAVLVGARDGVHDARAGKPPYSWKVLSDRAHRKELLRAGLKSVAKILILAVILDAIYQVIALHSFYIGENLLVAVVLAFVPYLIVRGPANRITLWWMSRHRSHQPRYGNSR